MTDHQDIAISVENLGKQYRLGTSEEASESIAASVMRTITSPIRNYKKYRSLYKFDDSTPSDNVLWALKDLSFEVPRGQVMGIVGMNGAGKSTLLKILASITPPSTGKVKIRGRVSSLLEVGTGFHPELTGRENVYLNGTMMGMSRVEVDRKFDEIVDFSGVEKFLDTPVKRYSSGMRVRLAFAVAAHLEPEILIIDEVLAVGDAGFQKKCLGSMEAAGRDGRTVLFVSHNLPAVTRLCSRAILLRDGQLIMDDTAAAVVAHYLSVEKQTQSKRFWEDGAEDQPGDEVSRLVQVRIKDRNEQTIGTADIREPIGLEMTYDVLEGGRNLMLSFSVHDEQSNFLFVAVETDEAWLGKPRPAGRYTSTAWIPGNLLSEGTIEVGAHMATMEPYFQHFNAEHEVSVQVIDPMEGGSARGNFIGGFNGLVRPKLDWHTETDALGTPSSAGNF